MSKTVLDIPRSIAVGVGVFAACSAIALAQNMGSTAPCGTGGAAGYGPSTWNSFDPEYNSVSAWQTAWDTGAYDRNHVIVGTVAKFAAYRLTLNSSGEPMTIDLKQGTVIAPEGLTPSAGERVAIFGYWSNGTFIANRVVLHNT